MSSDNPYQVPQPSDDADGGRAEPPVPGPAGTSGQDPRAPRTPPQPGAPYQPPAPPYGPSGSPAPPSSDQPAGGGTQPPPPYQPGGVPPTPPPPYQPGGAPASSPYEQPAYGPGAGASPYGSPPHAVQPYPYVHPFPKNNLAVWSLVLGIVSAVSLVLCCGAGGFLGIPAIIVGMRARRAQLDGQADNAGMGTAGVVTGWVGVASFLIFIAFIAVGVVTDYDF